VLISRDVVGGRNTPTLTNIPAFATNSVKFYKLQAKSTTGAETLPYLKVQEPILNSGYLARLVRMNVEQK
jgi:hypothetical protein